jgi:hypothetical protein
MSDKRQEKTGALGAAAGKPFVTRVELPCGGTRLVGVAAAARWLGCSRQALGQVARGTGFYPGGKLEARARNEFPGLFVIEGPCQVGAGLVCNEKMGEKDHE